MSLLPIQKVYRHEESEIQRTVYVQFISRISWVKVHKQYDSVYGHWMPAVLEVSERSTYHTQEECRFLIESILAAQKIMRALDENPDLKEIEL